MRTGCCLMLPALMMLLPAGCSSPPPRQAALQPEAVKITHFYASPAVVEHGDKVLLCYGVEHAASVRLEPPVAELSPSPTRCVEVRPVANAQYTLVAKGADGSEVTAAAQVKVTARSRAAAPAPAAEPAGMIHTFLATAGEVARGQPLTVCYDVRGAESVSLQPAPPQPLSPGRQCVVVRPEQTTEYTLTARGGRKTETQRVTVRVK